jgi:hypothetical protein
MKPLVLVLCSRMDELRFDLMKRVLSSCNRREVKLNYSAILNTYLEKELNYLSEIKPSRRDLLRKCQSRSGYCRGTRIPYNGLLGKSSKEYKDFTEKRKVEKEEKIQKAFRREIRNHTSLKRHPYHPIK